MVRVKKEPVKKIVFKTKDGREVNFVKKPKPAGVRVSGKNQMKMLEKRLSSMEKAILHYNNAVQTHQARKKSEGGEQVVGKSGKQGDKPTKGKKAAASVVDVGKEKA